MGVGAPARRPQISDTSTWSAPLELAASSAAGLAHLAATPFVIRAITRADRRLLRLLAPRG
jgi:hypothetical protein